MPLFPIKIRCPGFTPLQLRISPVVLVKTCGELIYETYEYFHTSKLSIDFNVGASIGLVIEAGLFFDIKILGFSVSIEVQGNLFEGKVGIKFSIDFTKAQLVLNIYSEFFPLSFEFFIKAKAKILFVKITLLNLSYKIKTISLHSSEKITLDLYKMIDNFLDDESYYLI